MVALLTSAAGVAHADNRDVAREHYLAGTKDFDLGLYDDAIKEYMAAYKAKDDAALLYNLGQAHRAAQHAAEALHFYKRYLAKVPDARNAAEVQAKIDELQKLIDQQSKLQAMPPSGPAPMGSPQTAPAPTLLPGAPPSQPVVVNPPVTLVAQADAPPPPRPIYKKGWFWGVVVGAAVVVAVGVGLGVGLSGGGSSFNAGIGTVGPGAK